jgi:glutaredoxin-like protein NrdH
MGAVYHVHDLETMPDKLQEFMDEGHLQAPVVEAGGERWSGFRPDKLGEIALSISNDRIEN